MRRHEVDEEWLENVRQDMLDEGYDEEFIECCLEDLRDGETVCGPRAHHCGCECGGKNDPDSLSCGEAWELARTTLKGEKQ